MSETIVRRHSVRDTQIDAAKEAIASPSFGNELLYTVQETAQLLKVTTRTIHNLIRYDKLKSIWIQGVRRIPRKEIEWLASLGTGAAEKEAQQAARQAVKRPDFKSFLTDAKRKPLGYTGGGLPVYQANEREMRLMDNSPRQQWNTSGSARATTEEKSYDHTS